MAERCALLIGTRKGAFVLEGDRHESTWDVRGPLCEGWPIHDMIVDPATGAILAAGGSPWYGASVWRSHDLGASWTQSSEGLTYGDAESAPLGSSRPACSGAMTAAPSGVTSRV